MLPWKKVSEIEPPMNERLLLLQADGMIDFGNYCEVGKGRYLGMGKWSKYEKQFIDEQDEQPSQIYPTYYILEYEIPKP